VPVPERQQVCHQSRSGVLVLGSHLVERVRREAIDQDDRDITLLGQLEGARGVRRRCQDQCVDPTSKQRPYGPVFGRRVVQRLREQ
jgi:hypothetical protein